MTISPIHSDADLNAALSEVAELMMLDRYPDAGVPECDRLAVISTLIEVYETRNFPIEAPRAVEALNFRLDQTGLSVKDIAPTFDGTSRADEILSGKRRLTLPIIRRLNSELGIPAEALIQ
jgi:HTH-type transcriptional regulator/antitoxin HigA